MSTAPQSFDLDAAWIRRAQTDLRAFMEALAIRFETALPGRVTVDRRRDGMLSRTTHVREITIDADDVRLSLVFDKGRLRATRVKSVRGVTISTTELPIEQWLADVQDRVAGLSGSLSAASDLFRDFL